MIDSFFTVEVALMNGVDANIAGAALRIGPTSNTDADADGFCAGKRLGQALIGDGLAQVVDMRGRDIAKTLELLVAVDNILPFKNASRGGPGETLMGVVRVGQPLNLPSGRISLRKWCSWGGRGRWGRPPSPSVFWARGRMKRTLPI